MQRSELVKWLDSYLEIDKIPDGSLNGLQFEGSETVTRIACAVDSSLATIEAAVESGADFLIVHHGWFWKNVQPIVGPLAKRVKAAAAGNLNLYVSHLPLDAHPEVGNNIQLAKLLSLKTIEPFGKDKNLSLGFMGQLPVPLSLQDLADTIQKITGEICLVHAGGNAGVSSIGIISGGAAGFVDQAAKAGLDCFITGEPSHANFPDAFEYGINAIFCGHYESEVFGVKALSIKLEDTFGIPWQFLHLPSGL